MIKYFTWYGCNENCKQNFHRHYLQGSFSGKSSLARICGYLLCLQFCVIWMGNCSWFTDGKHCFTDDESTQHPFMNNTWKYSLVIGSKVYVAWKRKMLHDIIGGHQAYIQRNKHLFNIYGASNFAAGLDHAQLADCTRISHHKMIKSLRSRRFAPSFARNYSSQTDIVLAFLLNLVLRS